MRKIIHTVLESCTGGGWCFAQDLDRAKKRRKRLSGSQNLAAPEKEKAPNVSGLCKIRRPEKKMGDLAERIHQFVNRAVQILVAPAESVDLVDRMKDCRVVFAAELPPDFRKRRLGKLLDQVHCNLARERDRFRIGTYFE